MTGKNSREEQHHQSQVKRPLEPSAGRGFGRSSGAPNKRSRVSRACDQCRASREKCDGNQPICQTCSTQKRNCSYDDQPKKRGIQPNYIRTLELIAAWLFQTFPESQKDLATSLSSPDSSTLHLFSGKDPLASESLHQSWRESIVCRQVDQILSGSPIEVPSSAYQVQLDRPAESPSHIGQTESGLRFEESYLLAQGFTHEPLNGGLDNPPPSALLEDPAVVIVDPTDKYSDAAKVLKLPESAWTLLDYYFAFTQSWLPMTDKPAMLKLMYSYPAEGLAIGDCNAQHTELWSILALAASQLSTSEANVMPSDQLRDRAWHLFDGGKAGILDIGYVRAALLIGLVHMTKQNFLAAWLSIGFAGRYLVALRKSTYATGERFGHVSLAAYVLETAIASHLGLPAYLEADHLSRAIVDEDGLDEWSPWNNPLSVTSDAVKLPAKANSTLNRLARIASRNRSKQQLVPEVSSVVFALLRNAAIAEERLQPTVLLARYDLSSTSNDGHVRQTANAKGAQSMPFMSIPNDADTSFSPTLSNPSYGTAGVFTPTTVLVPTAHSSNEQTNDIFEELAMLERTDSSQQPQFMQNLGFGPDLDLAEFFGADYRPSDPLLAYMQPSLYSLPQPYSQIDAESG